MEERLYLLWRFPLEKLRAGGYQRIDKPCAVLAGSASGLLDTALNEVVIASLRLDDMEIVFAPAYIEGVMAPDGEEQDAYILGVNEPVCKFTGKIIAIVYRKDDIEEKWVVVPDGMTFSKEEIRRQIHFQEQYFDSEIVM